MAWQQYVSLVDKLSKEAVVAGGMRQIAESGFNNDFTFGAQDGKQAKKDKDITLTKDEVEDVEDNRPHDATWNYNLGKGFKTSPTALPFEDGKKKAILPTDKPDSKKVLPPIKKKKS